MIIVNKNSWITLSEADAILKSYGYADRWFALHETNGNGQLSKTTVLIDSFYRLLFSPDYNLSKDLNDDDLKQAQAILCAYLLNHEELFRRVEVFKAVGLKSLKVDGVSEDYGTDSAISRLPVEVTNFISAYKKVGANSSSDSSSSNDLESYGNYTVDLK